MAPYDIPQSSESDASLIRDPSIDSSMNLESESSPTLINLKSDPSNSSGISKMEHTDFVVRPNDEPQQTLEDEDEHRGYDFREF